MTKTYRFVMNVCTPPTKWWGRMTVTGLEHLPATGPVLLAGNHDSYWDPIAVGVAAKPCRQIKALAKHTLWKPGLGKILDGMGQIPINRGAGDLGALRRAIEELEGGTCIGVFLEGTRSKGRELRARSGFGRLAEAVPEAEIVCVRVIGTVDIPRFPTRPDISIEFFRPAGGGLQPGERHVDFGTRLLTELRTGAPVVACGRKRIAAA